MRHRKKADSPVRAAALLTILACAAGAGSHAGLVPEHLRSEPRLGVAFIVAVVLLLAAAFALAGHPDHRGVAAAVAVLFAGLMATYAASRTSGIPLLAPDPEAVETVGVITNAVEALGLVSAVWLSQPFGRRLRRSTPQEVSR
jgi:peptidoglycan/LPS O-acetylase OafA/YrhL